MAIDVLPSGTVRARFRGPDGRFVTKSFPKATPGGPRRAAEKWERAERKRLDDEGIAYVDPKAAKVTVTEYARRWVESRPNRASTTKRYEGMIAAHLVGTPLGSMQVGAVRTIHLQEWTTSRSLLLTPSTLDRTYGFLQSVFKSAVESGLQPRTPCISTIKRPRPERRERAVLDDRQFSALVAATPARYRALVVLLATCGLRIGEALGLKVEDIDREGQVLHVRRQLDQRARTLTPLKTQQSRREVPLPTHVLKALAVHRLAFPPYSSDDERDGLLFTSAHGRPLRYDVFAFKVFRPAVEAAGLGRLTPHGLRHHAGSVMLHNKAPDVSVAGILGHSVQELNRTYAHPLKSGEDLARRAMQAAWTEDVSPAVSRRAVSDE